MPTAQEFVIFTWAQVATSEKKTGKVIGLSWAVDKLVKS
jgi:hypothetical protein